MRAKPNLRAFPSALKRREFLQNILKIDLTHVSNHTFTEEQVTGRNIENLIGATQIPLGVAGPIRIKDQRSKIKGYFIPLATTEGALVASVSRGCKAINEAGGCTVLVENVGITRGPVFDTLGIEHGLKVKKWVEKNFTKLAKASGSTSSHLKLLKIDSQILGRNIYLRFYFDSGDAMGMNMATFATQAACQLIEKATQAKLLSLAGNFDIDKKPSWLNFINGRGKKVWAEVILPKKVLRSVLKVSAGKFNEVVQKKCALGSILAGAIGFNSHFANIAAAIFAATGQDLAHVSEASLGLSSSEILPNGNLYFAIYLPSLQLGIVGGGTNLPTQAEALKLMKVKDVLEYSRAVAAAILAGELSLLASLSEGSLAKAHQKLARKK